MAIAPDGPELPNYSLEATNPWIDELERLRQCTGEAFSMAKAGAAGRAHQLLREHRDQAANRLPSDDGGAAEVLELWDAVLRWFERYVPPPH